MRALPSAARLETGLRRLLPWVVLVVALLWTPLVMRADHSWDDADPEVLNNAYRLSRGLPLYHGIEGPPWVVSSYPPLYHLLVAAGLRMTGLSYTPARLVSLLSTLAVAAALALLARRWRGRAREGLWAGGLLLLVPAVLYNAARPHPQMLAVALAVWSFVLLDSRRVVLADLVSPLLAVLAVYTKQTAIALPLGVAAGLAVRDRKRLLRWGGAVALLGLAPLPWLQATTHGAFLDSVVGLNLLPYDARQIAPVFIHHAGVLLPFLGLALWRFRSRLRAGTCEPLDLYFAAVFLLTVVSLGRAGAHGQYVLELLVVTVVFLLGTGGLRFPAGREALGALQIAMVLLYAPLFVLFEEGPFDRASLRAADPVKALLRTAPGPVLSQQGSFALFTRGEIHVQLFHFTALAREGRWDETPLLREVEERRFAWVVTESPLEGAESSDDLERFTPELRAALAANYVLSARIEPYYVYRPLASGTRHHARIATPPEQAVIKIQAEITKDDTRLLDIGSRRATLVATLNSLRDLPQTTQIPKLAQPSYPEVTLDREALRRSALASRPEIAQAGALVDLARKEYKPDVTLGVAYTWVGARQDLPGIMNPPPDNGDDIFGISATVNLPIHRKRLSAGLEEATERRLSATEGRRAVLAGIDRSLGELVERVSLTWQQLRLFKNVLAIQADQSLRSAEAGYSAGSLNSLDLLDAERVLLEVRTATERARADYAIALARLESPSTRARRRPRRVREPRSPSTLRWSRT